MKKILLSIAVIALFLTSCENVQKPKDENVNKKEVVVDKITEININDFDSIVGDFVGEKIQFSGVVEHICQHGGQRMFIVSPDSDARIKVTTDEDMAAFPSSLEGSNVVIVGVVDEFRIDEDYLKEWEEETMSAVGDEVEVEVEEGLHTSHGEGHKDADGTMERIKNFRTQLQESGQDHISFYSVICKEYKTKDTE